ncbi:Zn(2)-C6 fungal-type transcription factor [Pseudohyphozyma bogoriensis]|nr:Zn(2)-C6 fungal-type transcription factor [Pseudohyphozyma bogoriensis]
MEVLVSSNLVASTSTAPPLFSAPPPSQSPHAPGPIVDAASLDLTAIATSLLSIRQGLEQLLDRGQINARTSRQGQVNPKIKCTKEIPCRKCKDNGIQCEYPVFMRRGRKRPSTPNEVLLESLLHKAESVYASVTGVRVEPRSIDVLIGSAPAPSITVPAMPSPLFKDLAVPNFTAPGDSDEELEDSNGDDLTNLGELIENPLAILANLADGPQSRRPATMARDEEQGTVSLDTKTYNDIVSSDQFFSTGLYEIRPDIDPKMDPVNLGLLTIQELHQLVDFYFTALHPTAFYLDRIVNTPALMRETSTFLVTVVAFVSAGFCPGAGHLIAGLRKHADDLANLVHNQGFKSRDIVEGYLLLVHWAPMANNWGSDRQWSHLGQALRIATELRLDKDVNQATVDRYNSITSEVNLLSLYQEGRRLAWTLLFMAEISLCVSTGRLSSIVGLNLVGGI